MKPTTVLICNSSRAYAAQLQTMLEQDGSLSVVGISPSGTHALESLARLRPAVVAIDLDQPGMDAVRAIEDMMRTHPVPIVALRGTNDRSDQSRAALSAGALKTLPMPPLGDDRGCRAVELRREIKRIARATVERPSRAEHAAPKNAARETLAVGIGASTGGPGALCEVLRRLPADYPIPILVVQHISAGFLERLASWLDDQIALPVAVARDGAPIESGVWLAPDSAHLTVTKDLRTVLDRAETHAAHRPSVDRLFESMATGLGAQSVAVVLTGMGSDGARGVAAVSGAGGLTYAQDEASAAVFGMPREAGEQGAQSLDLDAISTALRRLRLASRRP